MKGFLFRKKMALLMVLVMVTMMMPGNELFGSAENEMIAVDNPTLAPESINTTSPEAISVFANSQDNAFWHAAGTNVTGGFVTRNEAQHFTIRIPLNVVWVLLSNEMPIAPRNNARFSLSLTYAAINLAELRTTQTSLNSGNPVILPITVSNVSHTVANALTVTLNNTTAQNSFGEIGLSWDPAAADGLNASDIVAQDRQGFIEFSIPLRSVNNDSWTSSTLTFWGLLSEESATNFFAGLRIVDRWRLAISPVSLEFFVRLANHQMYVDLLFNHSVLNQDANIYNHEIAIASLILSESSYREASLRRNLIALGFENIHTNYSMSAAHDVAYSFAYHRSSNTIIIVIRGTATPQEWISNITPGGFNEATHIVQVALSRYIQQLHATGIEINSEVRLWITGHSRGAAVANHLGFQHTRSSFASPNSIFVYTFASPRFAAHSPPPTPYNIFNIINVHDPIVSVIPRNVMHGRMLGFDLNDVSLDNFSMMTARRYNPSSWSHTHDPVSYLAFLLARDAESVSILNGRTIIIRCPVNIDVFDSMGTLVGRVINNVVDLSFEANVVIWIDEENDEKYFFLPQKGEFTFVMTGTDDGVMSISAAYVNLLNWDIHDSRDFYNIDLFKGKKMIAVVDEGIAVTQTQILVIEDGEVVAEIMEDGSEVTISSRPDDKDEDIPTPDVLLPPSTPQSPTIIPPSTPTPPAFIPWEPRTPSWGISAAPEGDYTYVAYDEDDDAPEEAIPTLLPIPTPPQSATRIIFTANNPQFTISGQTRTSQGTPFIDPVTDRMMVPLRTFAEATDIDVQWDDATRSAIIYLPSGTLTLPVDEPLPNGMGSVMIINDRVLIPLRFVMYAFNANVEWDSANRAAIITW